MARKGNRKVRTGCLTCKVRKVKCDEAKPRCLRCTSTGRKCDGYVPVTKAPANQQVSPEVLLYQPHRVFPGISTADEGRALQYFCETAGPFLSGATDPYFWTHLVMQLSSLEPTVKHSAIAISSLYEQLQENPEARIPLRDNAFALRYYNAAIHGLKDMRSKDNPALVLLVCILFTCIEFLQSSRETAIAHCKHGIAILTDVSPQNSWVREYLLPIFRRLSISSFFFGDDTSDFPNLTSLKPPIPNSFLSFSDVQVMMDDIFTRTLQVVRQGDAYRLGPRRYNTVPPALLQEQEAINQRLDLWQVLFAQFDAKLSFSDTPATKHFKLGIGYLAKMSRCFLLTRHEACRIWLNMAFEPDETGYDRYLEGFSRIFENIMSLDSTVPERSRVVSRPPKFIFESGFTPMLFFVVSKCRHLEMRLGALRLIKILGIPQENLFDVDTMTAMGRRIIEIEHSVRLDCSGQPSTPASPALPQDEMRIRDTWTDSKESHIVTRGHRIWGRVVGFFMCSPEDTIYLHTEFLPECGDLVTETLSPGIPLTSSAKA